MEIANKMNKENRISVPQNITFNTLQIVYGTTKNLCHLVKTRSKSYANDDEKKSIERKMD